MARRLAAINLAISSHAHVHAALEYCLDQDGARACGTARAARHHSDAADEIVDHRCFAWNKLSSSSFGTSSSSDDGMGLRVLINAFWYQSTKLTIPLAALMIISRARTQASIINMVSD
ncbi:hypothetical protein JQK15_15455 [Sphingobium sp. BHU LFT2]|uniref:hypothetical protein n=1 Tax=Sphingobium sp. BHU LFT2 TaxID=2807634 RepID=UPI001BE9CE91|nr:hypothetical protein [Sphingobium sp. BHU LFT2]MBT2244940.1 hypothetical protein [Sphingobium sp. BHU LFT2]